MRLLRRAAAAELVIGTGLVGDAVAHAARLLPGTLSDTSVPTDWSGPGPLAHSLEAAVASPLPQRLRVFWCAGRAGFRSTEAQCDEELRSFEAVLLWATRLAEDHEVELHLASSAGGLHEGQLLVDHAASARVTRPYGALKLKQEQALHASSLSKRFVYRLSSVYGIPLLGRRLGLVSTLALNALRHRPTLITAHATTQRDFVAAADVGTFIAAEGKPTTTALHDGVHYLVSGQPLSTWALQLALERQLLRRVTVTYSTGKENSESTTFSPRLRPRHWFVSTVESNLPLILSAMQGRASQPGVTERKPALSEALAN